MMPWQGLKAQTGYFAYRLSPLCIHAIDAIDSQFSEPRTIIVLAVSTSLLTSCCFLHLCTWV